jgi:hypothetical protein
MIVVPTKVVVRLRTSPMVVLVRISRGFPMLLACSINRNTTLDYLIEFPAIEPNTPVLGAIIDLDTGSLGHQEIGSGTHRAFHLSTLRKLFFVENDQPSILRKAYGLADGQRA